MCAARAFDAGPSLAARVGWRSQLLARRHGAMTGNGHRPGARLADGSEKSPGMKVLSGCYNPASLQ
ncbi:hypothetical protein BZM27_19660 [Paraburkholderia steynii]|uniref:Uncharacterized protein n=1 Tax=Paraburkholderia steynii TaxID=1245441 RepID=A0A4R0XE21_9BURK|nr:hypothetical protein BZM27_19660 [Paraburkholderia steynii]